MESGKSFPKTNMKTLLAQNHYQGQTIRTKEISNGRLGQCRYGANHKKGKKAAD
jgi:hypothetical protein